MVKADIADEHTRTCLTNASQVEFEAMISRQAGSQRSSCLLCMLRSAWSNLDCFRDAERSILKPDTGTSRTLSMQESNGLIFLNLDHYVQSPEPERSIR